MKMIGVFVCRVLGCAFLVAAFLQWLTFDYLNVNPFRPGAALAPGLWKQVVNWVFVCVLAAIGWALFTVGTFKLKKLKAEREG